MWRAGSSTARCSTAPAAALRGPRTGWSSLGVVIGATATGDVERFRRRLPHSLWLVPGYGAQGATAAAAVRGFVPGPEGNLEGGVVNSSRAILYPQDAQVDDVRRWERAVDDAVDRAVDELAEATRR